MGVRFRKKKETAKFLSTPGAGGEGGVRPYALSYVSGETLKRKTFLLFGSYSWLTFFYFAVLISPSAGFYLRGRRQNAGSLYRREGKRGY